jgi:hypothetical protein
MRRISFFTVMVLLTVTACKQKQTTVEKKTETRAMQMPRETEAPAPMALLQQLPPMPDLPTQVFTAAAGKTVTFTGKKGLKVHVNPQQLCFADGRPVDGPVKLYLKECLTNTEMILAGAPTVSNGRLLESGGSYHIALRCNNEELRLKNNEALQVEVPVKSPKQMQLFYGAKNEDGFVDWKPTASNAVLVVSRGTSRLNFQASLTYKSVLTGHEIRQRPSTLAECMRIYHDSLWKSRHERICSIGHKLTRKQEIAILYEPDKFPMKRYYAGVRQVEEQRLRACGRFVPRNDSGLSNMYVRTDTVPAYKYVVDSTEHNRRVQQAQSLDYYEPAGIEKLGWINIDRFYNNPEFATAPRIRFADGARVSACKLYVRFVNINSLMGETFLPEAPITEVQSRQRLPARELVEFIVVALQDGRPVSGKLRTIIGSAGVVTITLTPADEAFANTLAKN